QRNSYTIEEKCKVVELALRTSNSHVAQLYSLDLTIVGHWAQLYEWIMIVRQNGLAVTYPNIKLKMAKILDERPCNLRTILVFDFFKAHITDQAKTEFRSGNTDLAVIPRGLTSMCQPLDVCINKPFKDQLHKIWHRWIANSSNSITKKGNLKCARLNIVCCWVLDAWNEISKDIIVQAFKKCGISNCLSGSEDHLIYNNKLDEGKIEDFDKEEFDEDNEDEEFDKVDKVEESDKNEESDKDNESDGNESDYRVS
ncbi:17576_t:CDS:2, partial [Gigaspora margarita]